MNIMLKFNCVLEIYLAILYVLLVNTEAKYIGNNKIMTKVKRQVEIPNEECYNFDWTLDETSKKYYTCCKETNCTATDPQTVTSSNYECSPFGDTIYTKNITSKFNCGKCDGRKWAMDKCNARWKLAGLNDATDRCWIWSECFKGACAAQEVAYLDETKTVPQETNFCGDGFCLESTGETVDNCPIDCCPTVNSARCAVTSERCTDPCCNESGCCITSFSVIYIAIICGGAAFLNLICCCVCCCFYRKIKSICGFNNKKISKSISIDNLSRDSPRSTTSLSRKGYPPSPAISLNKKIIYVRSDHSPRPYKSSSMTSLNKKGLSRSTQSLDRVV